MSEPVKPKRKKTSRACNHCQKSHMTCDPSRPCKRCVTRGLSTTCEDAPRKRKKYLADVPLDALSTPLYRSASHDGASNVKREPMERSNTMPYLMNDNSSIDAVPRSDMTSNRSSIGINGDNNVNGNGNGTGNDIPNQNIPHNFNDPSLPHHNQPHPPTNDQNADIIRKRSKFLSSAADLEYSTLSNIISDNFLNPSTLNEHTPNSFTSPVLSPHVQNQTSPNTAINDAFLMNKPYNQDFTHQHHPEYHQYKDRILNDIYDLSSKYDDTINQYFLGPDNDKILLYPEVIEQIETLKKNDPAKYYQRNKSLEISFAMGILPEDSYITRISEFKNDLSHYFKEPEDIYEKVKKPYSYTPGYHSLIAYLRKRFNKQMLFKMAETMALYRPSFIACTNSLKEHDLIFMEQCFQRTLLTYDSIIKVSGTPTIVWRRTGEIAYVGNEFCILTGWTKEELLLHRKTFIVELLDDKSVLEYFQLFLKIAFGDFFGATMSECTLLTRKSMKIKTRCSWTLKRDVFGIPMMIIGNFLPIL